MTDEFKPGDIVQLKSGGPKMIVTIVGENQFGRRKVFCQWFDKSKLNEAEFEPIAVEPFHEESDELRVVFVKPPKEE